MSLMSIQVCNSSDRQPQQYLNLPIYYPSKTILLLLDPQ